VSGLNDMRDKDTKELILPLNSNGTFCSGNNLLDYVSYENSS
jgi:hypothetical protein